MRRGGTIAAAVILLLAVGCEQPFSPKRFVGDQYALQCFIGTQSAKGPTSQSVLLGRVYDVDGLDPAVNTEDPAVRGAEISLSINGTVKTMKEATRTRSDTSRYGPVEHYYTTSITSPAQREQLSIVAKMPDGHVLSAQTRVPRERSIVSNYEFPQGLTARITRQPGEPDWNLTWEDDKEPEEGHLFIVQLRIDYTKQEGSNEIPGVMVVPVTYAGSQPVYPPISTRTSCPIEFRCLDSAMVSIAAGDSDKAAYSMHMATLEILELDLPLSKYFSSTRGSLDQFSIRVNQAAYTNVSGGVGVFGSYFLNRLYYPLNSIYVKSFGYRFR